MFPYKSFVYKDFVEHLDWANPPCYDTHGK
jgi:hypothetical protein